MGTKTNYSSVNHINRLRRQRSIMQAEAMELWNGVVNLFKDAADTFLPVPPAAEIRENQETETDEKLFTAEADALASSGDSAKQALAGRLYIVSGSKTGTNRGLSATSTQNSELSC